MQHLTGSVVSYPPDQESSYAQELLPDAGRPQRVMTPRADAGPAVEDCDSPPDELFHSSPKPLAGVRFGPESAPGPSGRRPEHLRDMLACSRRRAVNRLQHALGDMQDMALTGKLPECWDWILNSRLVFLAKKSGLKPRPVRVGELWRRVIAKRALHKHLPRIRQVMLEAHQYGVAIPGGAEILVHARRVLEECICQDPANGVWAVIDADLVNCFPSLEWDGVDETMSDALPDIAPWTAWCHKVAADIELPSGRIHRAARGAEQGDPHGSLQAGLVLARCVREALADVSAQRGEKPHAFTMWFADDGQLICRPADVHDILVALDAALARAGATRGTVPDAKTVARFVGHPEALLAHAADPRNAEWATDHVRATCHIGEPNCDIEVLGAIVGTDAGRETQFQTKVDKLAGLHDALATLAEAPVEMVLGRLCADVSKVNYLLRLAGDTLSPEVVSSHDTEQRRFLGTLLGGGLHDMAFAQAASGVRDGGLGFRTAALTRQAAAVASRVEARSFVQHLFNDMSAAGVAIPGCMARYDRQVEDSVHSMCQSLTPGRADAVRTCCADAALQADARFAAFREGRRDSPPGAPVGAGHAGAGLLHGPETQDEEHPAASQARLQSRLSRIVDANAVDEVSSDLTSRELWDDVRRVNELRDDSVSHEWLWAIGRDAPGELPADEFITAVRLRLGADHADESVPCRSCGRAFLCPKAYHALCCACGPSTRGHNEVRDVLLDYTRLADATAEPEVLGLIASAPGSRPADILTTALSMNQGTALDVGIASPHAVASGKDCTETMRKRKEAKYAPFRTELVDAHVVYRPLIWSCYGREHPDTTAVLHALCRRAARRQGLADHLPLLARVRAAVGIALARRNARMVHACLRQPAPLGWAAVR